ncbi:unnamed protein product [Miscanthus lutarioriparius]|uniref:Uncharacterized protein n=1 Tax=Miscanthus lutarioriparius TaxID=422564 RepID=A0A811SNW9_9POAL|nr:unnamed protein product [Miscanthus lutarioriparius]
METVQDMEVDGHEVEQQQYLNEKALYDVSSGAPRKHGRLAIAHELRRANGRLEQENRDKDNALQQSNVLVGLVLAAGSLHAASRIDNNANDVCHTNEDLHLCKHWQQSRFDNNGDHASII